MKIINKILFGILGLLVLLFALILLCSVSPDLREKLSNLASTASNLRTQSEETLPGTEDETIQPDNGEETVAPDNGSSSGENSTIPSIPDTSDPSGSGNAASTNTGKDQALLGQLSSDYVSPGKSTISVPGAVSGKNGRSEISAENKEITDKEAEDLKDSLDYGDSGDGYTFDETFYPYYAMLDTQGQHLYRQIYANAKNACKTFAPVEQVSTEGLKNIFACVFNDHPELFWLNTAYSAKYDKNGDNIQITLSFNETADSLGTSQNLFQNAANSIIQKAQEQKNDYEKERVVHNALIDQVLYNTQAKNNQSAYSALVGGQSVCAGYARAFQYMMMQMGIPCYYCTGYAGESHAWTILKLDDGYYNVDPTWDDVPGAKYDYFNKTDTDYATTHLRTELSVYLPACNGTKYRNLEKDDTQVTSNNPTVSGNNGNLRKLSDFGLSQADVLKTLDAYFTDCYNKIVFLGKGSYTFSNVVDGSIINSVNQAYQQETYQLGYMENALQALGGGTCHLSYSTEAMADNLYLVTHNLTIE